MKQSAITVPTMNPKLLRSMAEDITTGPHNLTNTDCQKSYIKVENSTALDAVHVTHSKVI